MRVFNTAAIYGDVHPLEEDIEERDISQLCLAHKMKVIGKGNVRCENIEVGAMVGREDISLLRVNFPFVANGVEDTSREQDAMRPYFF